MRRKIISFCAALMLLGGIGVFFYPAASKYFAEYKSKKAIEEFQTEIGEAEYSGTESGETAPAEGADSETEGSGAEIYGGISAEQLEGLRQELQTYNEQLYQAGQTNLQDPFDYEMPSFDLTKYGFSQNIIGTLWVPRMEVELPIYLGANSDTMAEGAGLLGQTSMPLGGANTNVVLAAHRGWKGIPMFRDIQSIQPGDKVQITTPWETLVYRVCELKIILPGDSDEILIQEGRDLVTLLTCHPYTQNYQRYLVLAERSMEEPGTKEEDLAEVRETYVDEPRTVEMIHADGTSELLSVDPSGIRPVGNEGAESGAEYSNLQIWLEDYGTWMGFAVIAVVILLMLLSGRKRRKERRK